MDLREKSERNNRHPWELARFQVIRDLIEDTGVNLPGKNILDLGCGDLFFIQGLKKEYPDARYYGIDIAFNDNYLNSVRNSFIHAYRSLEDLPDKELNFDIILLMDVIEHIENDRDFLENLVNSKYVSPTTTFIITVPAFQSLFTNHDYFLKHFRRYNNETLENLTSATGLKTMDRGYFFFSLLIPRYIEKKLNAVTGGSKEGTGLTHWNKPNAITKGITKFLILDYKIQKLLKKSGIRMPGLSNYIICKKPA